MFISKFKPVIAAALVALTIASCSKKEDPKPDPQPQPNPQASEVHINFVNYSDNTNLAVSTGPFTNASSEQYTVGVFNYYISNIKLKKADGSEFAEPDSYHLVSHGTGGSGHFHIENVPPGDYTSVTFMVGVDSLHNVSGAQAGDLAPEKGMFWDWNTGYIMAKLEGTFVQGTETKNFVHHIGGFSGKTSGIRTVTLNFPSAMKLTGLDNTSGDILIKTDVQKWFSGVNLISLAAVSNVMMASPTTAKIADNYATMFSLTSVGVTTE